MGKPAARKTDPHPKGPIVEGNSNVVINGLPATRLGDPVRHGHGTEPIAEGEPSVLINGKPAARMVYSPDTWWRPIRGHGEHIKLRHLATQRSPKCPGRRCQP